MDNDLETLLNETLQEFPENDLDQEFLEKFSQNIQFEESLKKDSIKSTINSLRSKDSLENQDENVDDLLDNLNSLMDNGEFDSLLSGVMDQIMSKELLYDPLKDLSSKYPEFLLKSKDSLSKEEFNRFERQFNIVNEIISVYDNGDDPEKVLKLMQDVNSNFNILDARNW